MEGTLQGALLAALLFGGYQASGLCLARRGVPGGGLLQVGAGRHGVA